MSDLLASLVLFAVVATITPGGATTLATASGIQFGFRRSVPLLLGIAAGLAGLAAAAASGLAVLLQSLPMLEVTLKLAGTAYLLWLAYRIACAGAPDQGAGATAAPFGFIAGALLLLINPKAWAMVLGAVASFAALSGSPSQLALIMAATFGSAAIGSLTLWCAGGMAVARILRSERQWRLVNALLGLLLAASILPIWLA
ncbi:LysE family translocator [Pelagibius sp.]|uniref:LysE family translocator n=1 Tax=Pelagibius sp. TaxID=1931238 RepID=UPI002630B752|nr:LysE family transporter [Pelagibius sp.]